MKILILFMAIHTVLSLDGQDSISMTGTFFPYANELRHALDTINKGEFEKDRNQPMIIDLFSSSCVVCFKSLPKIQALQNKFKGRMVFVLVAKEDKAIRKVYNRFREKYQLKLPVMYDSVMHTLPVIDSYPKYVWIDRNNITRMVSGLDELTEENIQRFISNESITSIDKKKYHFDPARPYLLKGNGGEDSSFLLRSVLTLSSPATPIYLPPDIYHYNPPYRFQVLRASIDMLYNYAFHGYGRWGFDSPLNDSIYPEVIFKTTDSIALMKQLRSSRYNYSVMVKDSSVSYEMLQHIIKNDLENYFGYEARVEERLMPCWLLRADAEKKNKLKTKGQRRSMNSTHASIKMVNVPVSRVIEYLYGLSKLWVKDETNIDFNIDLSIEAITYDLAEMQRALKEKGLLLERGHQLMKVIELHPIKYHVAAE